MTDYSPEEFDKIDEEDPSYYGNRPYPGDFTEARKTLSEKDVFAFLDKMRESGVTNMFGASPYIREEFPVTRYEANRLLAKWMETYSERNS